MKYKEKDFKIRVGDNELAFVLKGKSGNKNKIKEVFDGNETIKKENKSKKSNFIEASIGTIMLDKGKQSFLLNSGKDYYFKTTLKEFHKQDRKYRGFNIEVKSIKFVKQ